MSRWRIAVCTLVFLGAYALGCGFLARFAPEPVVPIVSPKLDWWRTHAEEYDTLIIGSSRTYRQIIPATFDAAMAAGGIPTRSYNLGIDGMRPPEDTYLLERALAAHRTPLRFVVMECNALKMEIPDDNADTLRAVYWHDLPRMGVLWRLCFAPDYSGERRSAGKRFSSAWGNLRHYSDHARLWLWRNAHVGAGNERLLASIGIIPSAPTFIEVGPRKDGYRPPTTAERMSGKTLADYERRLAEILAHPAHGINYSDAESQRELLRKRDIVLATGARPIFIAPPLLESFVFTPAAECGVTFLNFAAPARYPALYALENRRDSGHTNSAGSDIYTRLLADSLLHALHDSR